MAVCGYHPGDRYLHTVSELAIDHINSDPSVVIPQAIADLVLASDTTLFMIAVDAAMESGKIEFNDWARTRRP